MTTTARVPVGWYVGGEQLDLRVGEEHRFHAASAEDASAEHTVHLRDTFVFEISVGRGHGCGRRTR